MKWYLMRKKQEKNNKEENDTYDNLIWVPKIDVVDLNNFNKYINEEEKNYNSEILNLIKKLEEKENMISILSFKLEKLEKDFEINNTNTYDSIGQNIKNKNNQVNYRFKNSISEENIMDDNRYACSIIKDYSKSQKSNEKGIPIEKYNNLLEKLNKTEENYEKTQRENTKLIKYKKLYLAQNNNISISNENFNEDEELKLSDKKEENKTSTNKNNEISKEEDDYYKNKYNELEMKLKILKEGCKNILMKLTIPKKNKEEIKQILKLFEYSDIEISSIIGDKKF